MPDSDPLHLQLIAERDSLRAEIVQTRHQLSDTVKENEALRAELQTVTHELGRLKASVASEQAEW